MLRRRGCTVAPRARAASSPTASLLAAVPWVPCPHGPDPLPGLLCQRRGALTGSPGNATVKGFFSSSPQTRAGWSLSHPNASSDPGAAGIMGPAGGGVTAGAGRAAEPVPHLITPLCRDPETPLPRSVQPSRANTRGNEFGEGEAVIPAKSRHHVPFPGTRPLSPG